MKWIVLGLTLISASVMAQNITRLEYFFDNDPGFGNAISIPVSVSPDQTINFNIDLSAITTGFHVLYLRGKDANGHWSLLNSRSVFVQDKMEVSAVDNVNRLEYFFDSDPGIGNATAIVVPNAPDLSQNVLVDLTSVAAGFHSMVLRARNGTGRWSLPVSKTFVAGSINSDIVAIEYFYFDGAANTPIKMYNGFAPGKDVTVDFNAILVGLLPNTSYEIHLTAINAAGQPSQPVVRVFTTPSVICNVAPPLAADISRCDNGTITLTASGAGPSPANYNWFDAPTAGSILATGPVYAPTLVATQTFYVSIVDGLGLCESIRKPVIASVVTTPPPPGTAGSTICTPASVTLTASGGINGNYRWYLTATGGAPIPGEINSTFLTPVIHATTTYYVAISNGSCESARTAAVAAFCNRAPVIVTTPITTTVEGQATIDLTSLISDADDNADYATLRVSVPPASGATVFIDPSLRLTINYDGLAFAGTDSFTIEICDAIGSCTQQAFSIDVIGEIIIYNAISPNGDNQNETWTIQYIEVLQETRTNHVTVFNRWGDTVFEAENYDNVSRVFRGLNKSGGELPSGTYFYRIEFESGKKTERGYLVLTR